MELGISHIFNTSVGHRPLLWKALSYVGGAVQLDVLVAVPFMLLFM